VIEATTWLRPPRGGDTIFLLVLRLEKMADINFKEVREAVATSGVRVVGFQLGVEDAEGITFVTDDGGLNYTQAFTLGEDSGGGVIEWDTEAGKRDALTSEQLDALKRLGEEAYKRITDEYYLLQVDFIGPKLSISLAPSVLERTPWVSASYPRNLSPCSGTALPGLQPCKIPVRVTAPDLSSLSENEAANVAARWKETLDHTEIEAARSHAPQGTEDLTHASSLQDIASVKTEIVGDLEASAFVARDKLHSVAVRSVSTDEAPRRIVFVVDNGNNLGSVLNLCWSREDGTSGGYSLSGSSPEGTRNWETSNGVSQTGHSIGPKYRAYPEKKTPSLLKRNFLAFSLRLQVRSESMKY
jgi:hypothetical protein